MSAQQKKLGDEHFIDEFQKLGAQKLADKYGYKNVRTVQARRASLEQKHKILIKSAQSRRVFDEVLDDHPERIRLNVTDGIILIGSDAHYWPSRITTAHKAFVHFCRMLKPQAVILNGDMLDGATISRHSPIGWENRPSLVQEIDSVKERLDEILKASSSSRHIWTLGNHDARYETRLATVAPEYAKIHGVHLKDHFPEWMPAWSCWINGNVVVKHRYKGGIHATHNNAMASGVSMVTGHLHSQKVTPYTDYTGTRWGFDTGTMADTFGPQFTDYMEDNPRSWISGFGVLTFVNGELLTPEPVRVMRSGLIDFRGEIISL